MNMHHPINRRSSLLVGAATLAMLSVAQPSRAEVAMPTDGTLRAGNVEFGFRNGNPPDNFTTAVIGQLDQITRSNGNREFLTINVGSDAAIIDWKSFSIGRDGGEVGTVSFLNNNGGNPFAVLNRVTGNSASVIEGILAGDPSQTAGNRGSIWVVNPNGVVFGPQSSVTNMSSFVASTLSVLNDDFDDFVNGGAFASGNAVPFGDAAGIGANRGIVRLEAGTANGQSGADLTAIDGVVLLVARRIDIEKGSVGARDPNITAGGDVGFVVARSASVQLTQNSLVQMGIAEGSDLAGGQLIAGGVVNGARIFAAVANRATLTEALLNVTGSLTATHAVTTENGIVLRAGKADAGGQVAITMPVDAGDNLAKNIDITGTLKASASRIDIAGNGTLSFTGTQTVNTKQLTLASDGAMTLGTLSGITGNASATAGGALSVTGLTSGGNVTLQGASVALGAAGLSAVNAIDVTAATTAITTAGATLRSNSGDADTDATLRGITLTAATNVGTQGSGPALVTGVAGDATKLNDVSVTAGSGGAVNLGAITARGLTIAPAGAGDIRLGAVNLTDGLTLVNAGLIDIASVTTGDSVSLTAGGSLKTGSIDNNAGTVTLAGTSVTVNDANDLTVATVTASNGLVSLTTATGLTASGAITAKGGGITLSGTSLTLKNLGSTGTIGLTTAGAVGADTIRAFGGITIAGGATSVTAKRIEANGNISITTGGTLTVSEADALGTRDLQLNANLDDFNGTAGQKGDVTLSAGEYAVGNSISSTRNISFTRNDGSTLDLTGFTLDAAAGSLTIDNKGGAITLGAGTNYKFKDDLLITAKAGEKIAATADLDYTGKNSITIDQNELQVSGTLTFAAKTVKLADVTGLVGSGDISLSATDGKLTVGSVESKAKLGLSAQGTGAVIETSGNTSFKAAGELLITGTVSINNGLTVTGAKVKMDAVTTRASGANAGNGDVVITADSDTVEAKAIASRGGITVAADTADKSVTLGGATAEQGVLVTAGGAATIAGAVTTKNGKDYTVRAKSVTVGTAGESVIQQAAGGLLLRAIDGDVNFLGTVSLEANSLVAGPGNLVVDADGLTGNITGTIGPNLKNVGGKVLLLRADNSKDLTLGNIEADSLAFGQRDVSPPLTAADYSPAGIPFEVGGDIDLGIVKLKENIFISNEAAPSKNIRIAGATSTDGNVTIYAGHDLIVGTVGEMRGVSTGTEFMAVSLRAGRRLTGLGTLSVTTVDGNVTLSAGTVGPDGTRSLDLGAASTIGAGEGTLDLVVRSRNFNGLRLGAVTAKTLAVDTSALNYAPQELNTIPGTVDFGSLVTANDINLKSGGNMTFGGVVTTTGDRITLDAGGDLFLGGNVTAKTRVVALGNAITTKNIRTGNDIVVVARTGNIDGGQGAEFRTEEGKKETDNPPNIVADDATDPVDGSGTLISGLPQRVKTPTTDLLMKNRSIVVKASGEIIKIAYKSSQNLSVMANVVEVGEDNDGEDIVISANRITGGDIVAVNSILLTSDGINAAGSRPDGIYVRSLVAGTEIRLTAKVDIAVQNGIKTTNGQAVLTALTGKASVGGIVEVGGANDFIIRAGSIELGKDGGAPITQSAGGGVLLQSATGAITALSPVTLDANGGQTVVDAATTIIGRPNLEASTNVLVRQGAAGAELALGNVSGQTLATAVPLFNPALTPAQYAAAGTGLLTTGPIKLGIVNVVNDLVINNSASGFGIEIEGATSSNGRIEIDSGLDLLIGVSGEVHEFLAAAASTGMILRAQRSILGSGTYRITAPTLNLEAGNIARGPNPLSVALGGATIKTTGLTTVLARTDAFEGLTIGNVDASGIDVKVTGFTTADGVRGPIVARVLKSSNSLTLVSKSDEVSLVQADVIGAGQDLVVKAATDLRIGKATAAQDIKLTAQNGQLSTTGNLGAGRDLLLLSGNGDMVATGTLTAGNDLKAKASGKLVLYNAATAGRDLVADGGSTEARSVIAGDDIVLIARTDNVFLPTVSLKTAGADNGDTLVGADGAVVTNPRTGGALGALGGSNLLLLAKISLTSGTMTGKPVAIAPTDTQPSGDPQLPPAPGSWENQPPLLIQPVLPPPANPPPANNNINCGPFYCQLDGGAINVGDISGSGSLNINADNITARDVSFQSGRVDMFSRGSIDLRSVIALSGIDMRAVNDLTIGNQAGAPATSVRNTGASALVLDAGRNLIVATNTDGGGDVFLLGGTRTAGTAPDANVKDVTAVGSLVIQGRSGVTTGALQAGTTATVRTILDNVIENGDVKTGTIAAGAIVAEANNGKLDVGVLAATRVEGDALRTGSITLSATRRDANLTDGTAGDIEVAGVAAGSALTLTAGRDIAVTGAIAMNGNATFTAARTILANQVIGLDGGSLIAATTKGDVTLGAVTARNLTATANSGKLTTGVLTGGKLVGETLEGGEIRLTATREPDLGENIKQGDIEVAGVARGNLLEMTAGRDIVVAQPITMTGNATMKAARDIVAGNIAFGINGNLVATALKGNVTLGTVSGKDITATANSGKLKTGRLDGAVITLKATRGDAADPAGDIEVGQAEDVSIGKSTSINVNADRDIDIKRGVVSTGLVDLFAGRTLLAGSELSALQMAIDAGGDVKLGADGAGTKVEVRGGIVALGRSVTITTPNVVSTQAITAGSIGIVGVSSVGTGKLTAGDINVRATGGTVDISEIAGGTVLVQARSHTTIGAITTTNGAVTVRSGLIGEPPGAGSGNLVVGNITTGTGDITLYANDGTLKTGIISGDDIKLTTSGTSRDISLDKVINAATLTADASGKISATDSLTVTGDIKLTGGTGVTTSDVKGANVTATATTGNLSMGLLSGGALSATANGGNAGIGGASGGSLALTAGGLASSGGIGVRGSAIISGGTVQTATINAGNIVITGKTSVQTGDLKAGDIDVRATEGLVNISKIFDSGTVKVQASGNTTVGAINSTGAVIVRSGQVGDVAGAATGNLVVGAVDAGGGAITLRANNGTLNAGALAGGEVKLAASGVAADMTLAGISRSTSLLVEAGRAVTANGTLRTSGTASITTSRLDLAAAADLRSDGRLVIKAIDGTGDVKLASGEGSLFDDADMPRVFATAVQIAGGTRNIVIGATTLFPNVLRVGVSTSGNITVTGAIKFESTAPPAGDPGNLTNARILTLGGDATASDVSRTDEVVNGAANVMAKRVVVETQIGLTAGSLTTGGQLIATNSVVRVRGDYVALGMKEGARFIDALLGTTPLTAVEVRTKFTELPISTFYQSIPAYANTGTRPPIVTASKLVLGVGQWGLVQNTGQSAQPGGGVTLNTVQLVNLGGAGAPQGGPIVGFFGSLGGQEGIAAALRVTVGQLGGITPNNVRINGCVALTTAGCIVTGLPLPLVQLNDPGRGLLIRSTPDLILPLELISGTTNEALWRDDEDLDPGKPVSQKSSSPPPRSGDALP